MQQQMKHNKSGNRTKLQHPDSEEQDENRSDDIDNELARIQANEDKNVACHNLTSSELAEINKKLELMH